MATSAPAVLDRSLARMGASDRGQLISPARSGLVPAVLLGALALAVRLIGLDHPVFIDELNHIMAARSWLADGTYAIGGDEPYRRALLFTRTVALFFRVLGESIVVARLPAVLAGAALVVFMFLWVRRLAGSAAAWVAALLLCFDPLSLSLSQIARFYTLQTLAFWAGAACLYHLMDPARRAREMLALAAGGLIGLNLAKHLSALSMIGWVAVAAGFLVANHQPLWAWVRSSRTHLLVTISAAAGSLALIAWWYSSGEFTYARHMFTYADMWAESRRNDVRYYHDYLSAQYGALWSLFPVVGLAALLLRPRPVLYWGGIFVTALVLQSLAAWKVERYLFYALPGFFAVTGVSIAAVLTWLSRRIRLASGRITAGAAAAAVILVAALTIRFGWGVNDAFYQTSEILAAGSSNRPFVYNDSDWRSLAPMVRPHLDSGAVVVASANLKSLYYLDRLDYEIAATHLNSVNGRDPEFTVLGKTGRPAFSTPASMAEVMRCHARGIIVVEEGHWARSWAVPEETARLIESATTPVQTPPRARLRVFAWSSPPGRDTGGCPPKATP